MHTPTNLGGRYDFPPAITRLIIHSTLNPGIQTIKFLGAMCRILCIIILLFMLPNVLN